MLNPVLFCLESPGVEGLSLRLGGREVSTFRPITLDPMVLVERAVVTTTLSRAELASKCLAILQRATLRLKVRGDSRWPKFRTVNNS